MKTHPEATHAGLHLLATRRFLPLFITQFLGAFNDNLFKMAMVMLVIFRLSDEISISEALLSNIASGLFILPYFLVSYFAGQLADKYEKAGQIKWIKLWEIFLMGVGSYAFYTSNIVLMLVILFGMGLQSTFFSPIKYAILPDLLKGEELVAGNGIIESGTFVSVLLGSSLGGLLILADDGVFLASVATLTVASIGLLASLFIPKVKIPDPEHKLEYNPVTTTWRQTRVIRNDPTLRYAVSGISWFWAFGSIILAQLPALVKTYLNGDEQILTLFLVCFSVGIAIGSLVCARLVKGQITASKLPASLIGIMVTTAIFAGCVYLAGLNKPSSPIGIGDFLADPLGWAMVISMLGTTIAGGIFVVPLYSILQHHAPDAIRSRVIGAHNIYFAVYVVTAALGAILLLSLGGTIPIVLLVTALLNLFFMRSLRPLVSLTSN